MTYLFVDTNIFLHFQTFDQIPWKTLIGGEIRLVVAPIVVSELDKHKRHKNNKIANRAKAILRKIEEITGGADDYPLDYLQSRPKDSTLAEHHLDRNEQDDLLLAAILDFKTSEPLAKIKLVSNDTGPRLRARNLQIDCFQLDEKYLLRADKSEEEKLIEQLTKENVTLKNRIPKLKVTFLDGSLVFECKRPPEVITEKEYVDEEYTRAAGEHYPLTYLDPNDFRDTGSTGTQSLYFKMAKIASIQPMRPTQYQIDSYNNELATYLDKYKKYLSEQYKTILAFGHSLKIELSLSNTGSAPAEDVDVEIFFPTNIKVATERDMPVSPKKPVAPSVPKSSMELFDIPHLTFLPRDRVENLISPVDIFRATTVSNESGSKANFYTKNLKQHQSDKIDTLYLSFPSLSEVNSFTFDYRMIVANIPDPICGRLHVKIYPHEDEEFLRQHRG